ncbi:MAG: HAMP domain-containing histidine kinase [Clostridia bacterium]|nr:HAMP domain-containing histidine kinase [Clostridia bacterium]
MKFTLKTLTDRLTAVFLFVLFMEISVAIALGISCMYDYHFYASDYKTYAKNVAFEVKSAALADDLAQYVKLLQKAQTQTLTPSEKSELDAFERRYDDPNATNVRYTVTAGGRTIRSNETPTQEKTDNAEEEFHCFERRTIYSDQGVPTELSIRLRVVPDLPAKDAYRTVDALIRFAIVIRYPMIVLLVLTALFALLILGALMSSVEVTDENGREKKASFIDRIPLDLLILMLLGVFGFFGILVALTAVADIKETNIVLWNAIILIIAFFLIVVAMVFNLSVAARIKRGHVYRNTLVYRVIARIRKLAGKENDGYFKVPFIGKAMMTVGIATLAELAVLLYFVFAYYSKGIVYLSDFRFMNYVCFWAAGRFILIPVFFMMALNLNRLRENGERLAQGDYQFDVDSHIMFGDFRQINANLNKIQGEMMEAAEEKNRSYRLRSELITNISHDIKTPLTSIVNYVDLLRSADPAQAQEYMDILASQSVKLKKLLENLIEVSKLTTGDISVQMEQLDAVMFIEQTLAEFAEQLEERRLQVVTEYAEEEMPIHADGDKLWRVFENLLGNVLKYAQPETRVYVGVSRDADARVRITFRNVSKDPIRMTGEELMHRFARADASRHSDGYGLGLSIARSLTEIQSGTFDVTVDGDLFRVDLTFRAAE